jgi:hypothetical protein
MLLQTIVLTIVFANSLRTVDEIKVPPNFNQRTEVSYGETTELVRIKQVFQQKAHTTLYWPNKDFSQQSLFTPISPDLYRRKLFRDCCMVG